MRPRHVDETSMSAYVDGTGVELRKQHMARARARLPGPNHYVGLYWIHQVLRPQTYVEIGVQYGDSLVIAKPPTRAVAIDPAPILNRPLPSNAQLFTMTSNRFFEDHDLAEVLHARHFSLAFIDGLHLFEQALLDFINLERYAGPESIILLHDCLPIDRETAARTRTTDFFSGDVWKLTLCLREIRPDLTMAIVPAAPTGLCLVSGFGGGAGFGDRYDECVDTYVPLDFDDFEMRRPLLPPAIPNTRDAITSYVRGLRLPS